MRDYAEQVKRLRNQAELERYYNGSWEIFDEAADAIEELLTFARWVAREAIVCTGEEEEVSAEILCRKLNKLGLVETDGELWMLPDPPKEVE